MPADYSVKNLIIEISNLSPATPEELNKLFYRHAKNQPKILKKSQVLAEYKKFKSQNQISLTPPQEAQFLNLIKSKGIRTQSGVTTVTVLTKPFPCPGTCIFCPNDVRMPKSYIASEPGAQRAFSNHFDPYAQTFNRLVAINDTGHPTEKIELIILGGTWSVYPETYQIWFVKRCFDALNYFNPTTNSPAEQLKITDFSEMPIDLAKATKATKAKGDTYNKIVALANKSIQHQTATWEELENAHKTNETAHSRCTGLVIETRPDEITEAEVTRIRKLGATKVQIGVQSLQDNVLTLNKRGHDVAQTKKAFELLRRAGFKIHAHWMPNLYGSTPAQDIEDYKKLFEDVSFRPDELKIYPCSLIDGTELMEVYKKGLWKPYTQAELLTVLSACVANTPRYCRLTRIVRDIPSDEIVTGNKKTNFRQLVEDSLRANQIPMLDIHSREIRDEKVTPSTLELRATQYATSNSAEMFLEFVTPQDKIAGFLRLSLQPDQAFIREIHVYGESITLGDKSAGAAQHMGLGKKLMQEAREICKEKGYKKLAVISSVGTREYYRKFGFTDGTLYQYLEL